MKGYIKSLRLKTTLMAGLLTVVSFKICGAINKSWLPALAVVIIASTTMVQNDWRDRFNDIKKSKYFVFRNPNKFFGYTVILWFMAVLMVFLLWRQNRYMGILPTLMILSGLLYSEIRLIPMVPIILVSATSASAALFPVFIGNNTTIVWSLFLIAVMIIFPREIIKDLEDVNSDNNYKWTLPLAIGFNKARILAGIIQVGLVALIILVFPLSYFIGIPFFLLAVFCLFSNKRINIRAAKIFLDIGAIMILISLLI